MVCEQTPMHVFAYVLRMTGKLLKEAARTRFVAMEMKRLQDDLPATLRRAQANVRGDHGSIAMSPKNCALDFQRVEQKQSFLRRAAMEIAREFALEMRGASVAGAIWNDEAHCACQGLNLRLNRVGAIAPPSVQEHDRRAMADVAIVDGDGRDSGRVRRVVQVYLRHADSIMFYCESGAWFRPVSLQ